MTKFIVRCTQVSHTRPAHSQRLRCTLTLLSFVFMITIDFIGVLLSFHYALGCCFQLLVWLPMISLKHCCLFKMYFDAAFICLHDYYWFHWIIAVFSLCILMLLSFACMITTDFIGAWLFFKMYFDAAFICLYDYYWLHWSMSVFSRCTLMLLSFVCMITIDFIGSRSGEFILSIHIQIKINTGSTKAFKFEYLQKKN